MTKKTSEQDPAAWSLDLASGLADHIHAVWLEQEISDSRLHDPAVQDAFGRGCAAQLGPTWAHLAKSLTSLLARPPYWAVLRLPGYRPAPSLLAAAGIILGTLSDPYQASWSRVLQEIATKETWTPDLEWHTDSTGWPQPNTFTMLSCVRPAPSGGATDLLALDTVRSALADGAAGALRVLESTRFQWPLDPDLGASSALDLVLSDQRVRFMRAALLNSADCRVRAAVQDMISLVDDLPPDASVLLEPGDLLVFDNRRAFHRRGSITDPERRRLLLRAKVA